LRKKNKAAFAACEITGKRLRIFQKIIGNGIAIFQKNFGSEDVIFQKKSD
jgi:hypothetical protein